MTDRVLSANPADLDRIHVRFATYRERSAPERDRFASLNVSPAFIATLASIARDTAASPRAPVLVRVSR